MVSFYNESELRTMGFRSLGRNVKISRKTSIYSIENISIGNNVRIDDFVILSGRIEIENNVHIAAYAALYGGSEGIFIADYVGLSSRVTVYSSSDDYSGSGMTNPTIPDEFKRLNSAPVIIEKHVIIGSTCVILPGVVLKEGSAIGALSFVNKSIDEWSIYGGNPLRRIKDRKRELLRLEVEYQAYENQR